MLLKLNCKTRITYLKNSVTPWLLGKMLLLNEKRVISRIMILVQVLLELKRQELQAFKR